MEWIGVIAALLLLYYPEWENSRRLRREQEREWKQKQVDFIIEHGHAMPDLEDCLEWISWRTVGRGNPYQ